MGRQNKNLSNAFDRFSDNKNGNKIITPVHKQEQVIDELPWPSVSMIRIFFFVFFEIAPDKFETRDVLPTPPLFMLIAYITVI